MHDHATHHDDCGCLTARYEEKLGVRDAELTRLRAEVGRLRGVLLNITECEEHKPCGLCRSKVRAALAAGKGG
jgi:hypothetical protein